MFVVIKHTDRRMPVLSTVMSQASQVAHAGDVRNWGSVRVSEKIPGRGMVTLSRILPPAESHGQKSLVGCSPGVTESQTVTERLSSTHTWRLSCWILYHPGWVGGQYPFFQGRGRREDPEEWSLPPASFVTLLPTSPLQRHDDPSASALFLCEAQSRVASSPTSSC